MGTSDPNDTKKIPLTKGYGGIENRLSLILLINNGKNVEGQKSGLKN